MGLMCRLPHRTVEAEKLKCQDTSSLGSGNLQGLIDVIADRVVNQLLGKEDVVDNLLSTETRLPLSANMGRVLSEKVQESVYFKVNNNPPYNIDNPGLPPGLYSYGYDNLEITGTRPPFNYGYLVNIKADNSLLFQIAFQYFGAGLYVRNYYSIGDENYVWSNWGRMITESDPDYMALKQNCPNQYKIFVHGPEQMFYPLAIPVETYGINQITLATRNSKDGSLRKAKAMWMVSANGWGSSPLIKKLKYYNFGEGDAAKIISKTGGLEYSGYGFFVIWIRGGCDYVITTDAKCRDITPTVYYEKTNLRDDTTNAFYVEPTNRIEDSLYSSDTDNL